MKLMKMKKMSMSMMKSKRKTMKLMIHRVLFHLQDEALIYQSHLDQIWRAEGNNQR